MDCPEEKKVKLETFLLQEGTKDLWTLYAVGHANKVPSYGMTARKPSKITSILIPSVTQREANS